MNYDFSLLSDLELKQINLSIKQEIKRRKVSDKKLIARLILNKILSGNLLGIPYFNLTSIIKNNEFNNQDLVKEIELFLTKINDEDLINFNIKNLIVDYLDIKKFLFFLWGGGHYSFDSCISMLKNINKTKCLNDQAISIIQYNISPYKEFKTPEMFLNSFLNIIKENMFLELKYLNYSHKKIY